MTIICSTQEKVILEIKILSKFEKLFECKNFFGWWVGAKLHFFSQSVLKRFQSDKPTIPFFFLEIKNHHLLFEITVSTKVIESGKSEGHWFVWQKSYAICRQNEHRFCCSVCHH